MLLELEESALADFLAAASSESDVETTSRLLRLAREITQLRQGFAEVAETEAVLTEPA